MTSMTLAVRTYPAGERQLEIDVKRAALVLIDCDGTYEEAARAQIGDALASAREAGMLVTFVHDDIGHRPGPRLPEWERRNITYRERAMEYPASVQHEYVDGLRPRTTEPVFIKYSEDAFTSSDLDRYLRTMGVDTVFIVGFALRYCFYRSCCGASERNYRVVALRDCTTAQPGSEFPDTTDASKPEGGWMHFAFIRQIEEALGYTSTSVEFASSLKAITTESAT